MVLIIKSFITRLSLYGFIFLQQRRNHNLETSILRVRIEAIDDARNHYQSLSIIGHKIDNG